VIKYSNTVEKWVQVESDQLILAVAAIITHATLEHRPLSFLVNLSWNYIASDVCLLESLVASVPR